MAQSSSELAGTTYQGSLIFSSVAAATGLPIDQFNFLFSELLALIFSIFFRFFLPAKSENANFRHLTATFLGLGLGFFCFGFPLWHIFAQSLGVYALLRLVPQNFSHLAVFGFAMIYLSSIHIHRMIFDYGNYTLDVSGPLMINTQKLTALAFAFYDGFRARQTNSNLSEDQKKQKIDEIPTILEFLSYVFYFQGICVGPLCFYRDYIRFITGENLRKSDGKIEEPSIVRPVLTKLFFCVVWAAVLLFLTPKYTVEHNLSPEMINAPWIKRLGYLLFSTFCTRGKYYFAFIFSEMINNASGLGFNGFDEKNPSKARWDLLTNVKPFELETGTSLKTIIDNWNIQTGLWLRRICYDRVKTNGTLAVFVLSAIWHGFYPGYYVCFLLASVETIGGRAIRQKIRPHFQKSSPRKYFYAILTWLGAQIGLNFATVPFVLLEIRKSFEFYQTWYFSVPILIVVLPLVLRHSPSKPKKTN